MPLADLIDKSMPPWMAYEEPSINIISSFISLLLSKFLYTFFFLLILIFHVTFKNFIYNKQKMCHQGQHFINLIIVASFFLLGFCLLIWCDAYAYREDIIQVIVLLISSACCSWKWHISSWFILGIEMIHHLCKTTVLSHLVLVHTCVVMKLNKLQCQLENSSCSQCYLYHNFFTT